MSGISPLKPEFVLERNTAALRGKTRLSQKNRVKIGEMHIAQASRWDRFKAFFFGIESPYLFVNNKKVDLNINSTRKWIKLEIAKNKLTAADEQDFNSALKSKNLTDFFTRIYDKVQPASEVVPKVPLTEAQIDALVKEKKDILKTRLKSEPSDIQEANQKYLDKITTTELKQRKYSSIFYSVEDLSDFLKHIVTEWLKPDHEVYNGFIKRMQIDPNKLRLDRLFIEPLRPQSINPKQAELVNKYRSQLNSTSKNDTIKAAISDKELDLEHLGTFLIQAGSVDNLDDNLKKLFEQERGMKYDDFRSIH